MAFSMGRLHFAFGEVGRVDVICMRAWGRVNKMVVINELRC